MACPDLTRYDPQAFIDALESLDLWEAMYCSFGAPLGELVVGTVVYSAFSLNIFIRTGSIIIPFLLFLILGGTVIAQMYAVISSFVGLIILLAAPVVASGLVVMMDRRG